MLNATVWIENKCEHIKGGGLRKFSRSEKQQQKLQTSLMKQ